MCIRDREADTGYILRTYTHHTDDLTTVKFSPDGNYMLSGGFDNKGYVWETPFVFINTKSSDRVFAMSAKVLTSCLDPKTRKNLNLPPDPPCWCQEKSYPPLAVWENDYLNRYPEKASSSKKTKPNPFTHKRDDGWSCPAKGVGYSAPWLEYPELSCLSASEILGSALNATDKIRTDASCFAEFERHGITVDYYLEQKR